MFQLAYLNRINVAFKTLNTFCPAFQADLITYSFSAGL